MKFTNFKTIKLATAPATGDNPPPGVVYEWYSLDGSNNLIINYRLSDGTDKTFAAGTAYELPAASNSTLGGVKIGAGLTITNGVLSAAGNNSAGTVAILTTSQTWTVPAGVTLLKDVWIIAGGGGGGSDQDRGSGGGGAGGAKHLTNISVAPYDSLTAVIGTGGAGATTQYTTGAVGGNTVFIIAGVAITAIGGGGGGSYNSAPSNGGSGGGQAGGDGHQGTGIAASLGQTSIIEGQGYNGGTTSTVYAGAGGGGFSSTGFSGNNHNGGNGGSGLDLRGFVGTSIGASGYFAGGGGGGGYCSGSSGGGNGSCGGGNGNYNTGAGYNATVNTGSGGGGSGGYGNGGNGGSGIIIIRY
ncbi:MAG: glycine-rich domain-containing protein [Lentisphaerota bacterium]